MSKRDHINSRPKKRNPYAKDLEDPMFRQRRIKSVKGYDRNNFNNFIEEAEDLMAEEEFDPSAYGAICASCVSEKGGQPPDGPSASTYWLGTCSVCKKEDVSCNDVWDWKWPNRTAPYWD